MALIGVKSLIYVQVALSQVMKINVLVVLTHVQVAHSRGIQIYLQVALIHVIHICVLVAFIYTQAAPSQVIRVCVQVALSKLFK